VLDLSLGERLRGGRDGESDGADRCRHPGRPDRRPRHARRTVPAGDRRRGPHRRPGFVDVHTHPRCAAAVGSVRQAPSPVHGITTVIGGNCGFTPAPLSDESAAVSHGDAVAGGGHPAGGARARGRGVGLAQHGRLLRSPSTARSGVNAGLLTGALRALRRTVMGAAANERGATEEQLGAMAALLDQCLAAGSPRVLLLVVANAQRRRRRHDPVPLRQRG